MRGFRAEDTSRLRASRAQQRNPLRDVGTLNYGNPSFVVSFDDRTLAQLQVVITAKLRRGESFLFSWLSRVEEGSGRSAIWLDPSSTIYYRYKGNRIAAMNNEWLNELTVSANRPGGMLLTPEPAARPARINDVTTESS